MRSRRFISVGLTVITFAIMVVVTSQRLPVEHGLHGGWIWGTAWFPVLIVFIMSFVVEQRERSSWWSWLASMGGAYSCVAAIAIWQHQSIWLLLSQAGLMEAGALGLGYLVAIVSLGIKRPAGLELLWFLHLFGLATLTGILWVSTTILWQTGIITIQAIPWLITATLIRVPPISRAFRAELTTV